MVFSRTLLAVVWFIIICSLGKDTTSVDMWSVVKYARNKAHHLDCIFSGVQMLCYA